MSQSPRPRLAPFIALLALAACATTPPPRHGGHRPPPGAGFGRGVFTSPMGEPFRGAGRDTLVAQWFAAADTDYDGRLSRAEFRADALRFFRTLDTDGDGELSADEVRHYETDVAPEIRVAGAAGGAPRGAAPGGRGGGRGDHRGGMGGGGMGGMGRGGGGGGPGGGDADRLQGGGRFGLLNIPEPVASADTDFNRRVTRAEFLAAADRRFDLLDPDGNGVLTLVALPHRPAGNGRRPA